MQPTDWQTAWTTHLNAGNDWNAPPTTWLTHFGNSPAISTPTYSYDTNGNLTGITASRHFDWTHEDRLTSYRSQDRDAAPSVTASYLYDAAGSRIKKMVERGPILESTVYIDGIFEYFKQTRPAATIEQNLLHITAGTDRVATIRFGTPLPTDGTPATKYVLGDHLGLGSSGKALWHAEVGGALSLWGEGATDIVSGTSRAACWSWGAQFFEAGFGHTNLNPNIFYLPGSWKP